MSSKFLRGLVSDIGWGGGGGGGCTGGGGGGGGAAVTVIRLGCDSCGFWEAGRIICGYYKTTNNISEY